MPRDGDNPAPHDAIVRAVLDLVARTHLHRRTLDPAAMLAGARASVLPHAGGVGGAGGGGSPHLGHGADADRGAGRAPCSADDLVRRLGPPLERLLHAGGGAPDADVRRARLLDGALRAADRWSSARSGRRRSDQRDRRLGSWAGVGVRIGRREGALRVRGVVPGSGAGSAGVRGGDVLLAVDGTSVRDAGIAQALALLRGTPGTWARLELERTSPASLLAERRAPPLPTASLLRRDEGAAILRIRHLLQSTPVEVARLLAGRARPRSLVLDLRGNTGGSILGAAGVADLFLDGAPGGLVIAEALDLEDLPVPGLRPRVVATPGGDRDSSLVVLVDRRTGSSAELLAASLAWHGRARLAGERTFGKNVAGKPHPFAEADLTVTITCAVLRAAGRRLPPDGLEPQHEIDSRAPDVLEQAARIAG